MPQTMDYATSTYVTTQAQGMSQQQMLLQLYDFAIAGCLAQDTRKASAAIVELIAALNFNYEEIAAGLYRLYEYTLREVKARRFEAAQRVLAGLREAWGEAFAKAGTVVPLQG
ncbi:MAG: flagellar protein FliS [Candidatus Rokubacteria bacterium]|nr:flagellar protein FliS [Candidatus Rokubacteria bacterium]